MSSCNVLCATVAISPTINGSGGTQSSCNATSLCSAARPQYCGFRFRQARTRFGKVLQDDIHATTEQGRNVFDEDVLGLKCLDRVFEFFPGDAALAKLNSAIPETSDREGN